MGNTPDLVGKVFGYLTVLEKTNKRINGAVIWKCQCRCGNIKETTTANLNSGRIVSCGCYNKEKAANQYKDLLNQDFGYLTVIGKTNKRTKSRSIIWNCRCNNCGRTCEVASDSLMRGQTKSCGCLQREKAVITGRLLGKDLIGMRFGKLTPIELEYDNNERTYICQCDCGNITKVKSKYLLSNKVNSCGCLTESAGEYVIGKILSNSNIPYIKQYHTKECQFPDTQYQAYFDFYVNNAYIIEYDGKQHFSPQCFNGMSDYDGYQQFIKTQQHDQFKNQWCLQNNIPLIRIPYTVKVQNINLEMLLPETSQFLLKEKNDE